MHFQVVSNAWQTTKAATPLIILVESNWDDWFQFNTLYGAFLVEANGIRHQIGSVKIGQFEMKPEQRRPDLPLQFEALGEKFFSLGQDDSYYYNISKLMPDLRDEFLQALRDLPFGDASLFEAALKERVTYTSLLRSVPKETVRDQFRRMALGGARLSQYHFAYHAGLMSSSKKAEVTFTFDVQPNSEPPTNIHVIIGRNGVGKTHTLNAMSRALVDQSDNTSETSWFELFNEKVGGNPFTNLVSVTFSAFDPFEPVSASQSRKGEVQYWYVGLKRIEKSGEDKDLPPKSPQMLSREFGESAKICRQGARSGRWARALKTLESDPIFKDAQVSTLAPSEDEDSPQAGNSTAGVFRRLSSGHKIVLLTITRLVETVAERTLVLLDEPEAHLHPPLLSAFIRALSDLMIDRNGVAIIATHSPVILQEVPKSCVWKLRRSGTTLAAERPEIETFGENVGILTREVFGLEVTESGFHKLLADSINESRTYEQVVDQFKGELGGEAKAIIRGLIASRNEDNP